MELILCYWIWDIWVRLRYWRSCSIINLSWCMRMWAKYCKLSSRYKIHLTYDYLLWLTNLFISNQSIYKLIYKMYVLVQTKTKLKSLLSCCCNNPFLRLFLSLQTTLLLLLFRSEFILLFLSLKTFILLWFLDWSKF